jgi:hypothetical protein
VEGHADHTGLRLAVETSVLVLLMGGWLWGIVALGAHEMAAQGTPWDGGGPSERAVVSCPAPRGPEAEEGGAAVGGGVCRPESRPHAGTSRQPGRSSENAPSTYSGE